MSANLGSTTMRNVPDVALTGDNVYSVYNNGSSGSVGGTSCAAPLWAGFMALVNQQAAVGGNPPVGFINPAVYAIGKSNVNYPSIFHDITVGNNFSASSPAKFSAATGYDLCTGWGTPQGSNLINTLTPLVLGPVVINAGLTLVTEACPPGNGVIDPGESVTVSLALKNTGTVNTTNLVVTLLATNGVTLPSLSQTYGTIVAGGGMITQSFSFTASGSCGGTITPLFQLQNGNTSLGSLNQNLPLGRLITVTNLTQNFDGVTAPLLPAGWFTAATGAQANWTTSAAANDTAPNAAFTAGASAVGVNELVSPAISIFSATAQLSFRHSYNLQSGNSTGRDGGVLEIKIGSGAFTDILTAGGGFVSGGYVRAISTSRSNPLGGRQAWTGNSGGFITSIVNLPAAAAGQTVQLKWRCGTDNSTASVGWYVDTVSLQDSSYVCCSGAPLAANLAISQSVSPTLLNVGSNLTFTLAITNLGPDTAGSVVVNDSLPAGITFVSATTTQGAVSNNAGVISCSLGALTNSAGATVTINATALTAGGRTNFVAIVSSTSDPVASNNTASASFSVNAFPTISIITNQTTSENVAVSNIAFTIGDAETAAAALTLTGNSSNTNLVPVANIIFAGSGNNRTVTLAPTTNASGSTTIFITVSDGQASASTSFVLTVVPVNHPPVLAPIANRTIHAGSTLIIQTSATDSDVPTNMLKFSPDVGAPISASINPTNGVFTWATSDADANTTNTFTIRVTDNGNPPLSDAKTFSVNVAARPVIQSISVSNSVVTVTWSAINGQGYRLQFKAGLADALWTDVTGDVVAVGNSAFKDVSLGGAQRFYRVVVLP